MRAPFLLLCLVLHLAIYSCNESSSGERSSGASDSTNKTVALDKVSVTRDAVKKEPVAQHVEKTDNPLNEWYFSVKLYETTNTFHYLMQLNFEEIRGVDTLKLPNFGTMPEPVIRKGNEKYSCIIGFLDKEKKFREYKKVYVKNNTLKVTALAHYAVSVR